MLVYALCAVAALQRGGNRLVPLGALAFCVLFLALGDLLYIKLAVGLAVLAALCWMIMEQRRR
jgi:hypothetical protein